MNIIQHEFNEFQILFNQKGFITHVYHINQYIIASDLVVNENDFLHFPISNK